jgi:two-component system, OmpR family, response regulator
MPALTVNDLGRTEPTRARLSRPSPAIIPTNPATRAGERGCGVAIATRHPAHVLAIDDDAAMRQFIAEYLAENDLRVTAVATGAEMEGVLAEHAVDMIVLDLRLAGEDGMQIAMKLREKSRIPIIIASGSSYEADRVMALELAADDYITKPFSPRELLARVRALLRRSQITSQVLQAGDDKRRAYRFAGWELNLGTRRLTAPDGRRVELTNGEFSLLQTFCAAPQRVLSREQLLELSRLHGAEVYDRCIDVQVLRLRRKIEINPSRPEYIRTERGVGYVFDTPVDLLQ